MKNKPTEIDIYANGSDEDSVSFKNGKISFSAYSYHIDEVGSNSLDYAQTRQLYETMKAYYEK